MTHIYSYIFTRLTRKHHASVTKIKLDQWLTNTAHLSGFIRRPPAKYKSLMRLTKNDC